MGQMKEMSEVIEEMYAAAAAINEAAKWLKKQFGSTSDEAPVNSDKEQNLTLEEVRAVLAEKSRSGFTKEVKEIITKHGAERLSDIDPSEYKAVLAETEEIGNA